MIENNSVEGLLLVELILEISPTKVSHSVLKLSNWNLVGTVPARRRRFLRRRLRARELSLSRILNLFSMIALKMLIKFSYEYVSYDQEPK